MTVPTPPSDAELLERMLAGDEEAFVALYRRYQSRVYCFALHMSGARTVAEDVSQEVFMALMRESTGYDGTRGTLQAYLLDIARHQVLRAAAACQGRSWQTNDCGR